MMREETDRGSAIASSGDEMSRGVSIGRSDRTDHSDHRVKVIQYEDEDKDVCVRYYDTDGKDEETAGYNYHDFSHHTWYDYTRTREPVPAPIEKRECEDIFMCLPFYHGVLRSLVKCSTGITSGWGFTANPKENFGYYLTEIINGLLCGMTMLPEIISFSFLAGIPPHVALHGTWIVCICAAVFGGSPGIMTGLSGALAAVAGKYALSMESPTTEQIEVHLWSMLLAVFLAGVILVCCSFFHLASISQFLSTSVIIGYSNGLAIVIARAQLHGFQDPKTHHYIAGVELVLAIVYCVIAFVLMQFTNKIPKVGQYLPPALLAVFVVVFIDLAIVKQVAPDIKVTTIGDVAFLTSETALPVMSWTHWSAIRKVNFNMTFVCKVFVLAGSIIMEALMVNDIIKTLSGNDPNSNQQMFGLGIGNMLSAFMGSSGGSSMVGISVMNLKAGSRGKESSIAAALFIFVMLGGGFPLLNYIPIPSLCGIMFSVSCHCFKWFSLPMCIVTFMPQAIRNMHPKLKMKITRSDAIIIVAVTIMCNLVIIPLAIIVGVVLAAFAYVWESKSRFKVEIYMDNETNIKYYEIEGNIFYASKRMLTRVFTPEDDPETTVIVLLASTTLFDYTAIETLNSLKSEYASYNKMLLIKGLSHGCIKKVAKMNHLCRHMEHDLVGIETPNLPTLYSRFTNLRNKLQMIAVRQCGTDQQESEETTERTDGNKSAGEANEVTNNEKARSQVDV
ncbi:sulfate transporter, putative [Babesia bigemina]|uniref:Sulfate transporter, putative n=1 Tax=Babesia bigemina TaxID=5866 RepID=A0A061D555_BABBI|nr:sulfate transporter, putative [Babesia bigemina]CDR94104.1 sulfate transporter, putative [Babesia bigemina]|eukprot:XP_012766290.1 sulfate transporter, putative [Babesia bigemina]